MTFYSFSTRKNENAPVIVKHTKHQGYKCIYMTDIFIDINDVKIKFEGNS